MRTDAAGSTNHMHWHDGSTCHGSPTLDECATGAIRSGWIGRILERVDVRGSDSAEVKCYSLIAGHFDHHAQYGKFVAEVKLSLIIGNSYAEMPAAVAEMAQARAGARERIAEAEAAAAEARADLARATHKVDVQRAMVEKAHKAFHENPLPGLIGVHKTDDDVGDMMAKVVQVLAAVHAKAQTLVAEVRRNHRGYEVPGRIVEFAEDLDSVLARVVNRVAGAEPGEGGR